RKEGWRARRAVVLAAELSGMTHMHRVILCAAIALSIAGNVAAQTPPADADACRNATGDDAIAACSRLIGRNPRNAVAWHNRGIAYRRRGEDDRAVADYGQAIRLDPGYVPAYNNRGYAYNRK